MFTSSVCANSRHACSSEHVQGMLGCAKIVRGRAVGIKGLESEVWTLLFVLGSEKSKAFSFDFRTYPRGSHQVEQ